MSNFTLIRYMGRQAGPVPYFGQATNIMYRFGIHKPVQPVDSRDVAGFLALREGQQAAFATVTVESINVEPIAPPEEPTDDSRLPNEPFDFTILSGVGPARNQTLHDAGITTVAAFLDNADLPDLLNASAKVVESWKQALQR